VLANEDKSHGAQGRGARVRRSGENSGDGSMLRDEEGVLGPGEGEEEMKQP